MFCTKCTYKYYSNKDEEKLTSNRQFGQLVPNYWDVFFVAKVKKHISSLSLSTCFARWNIF